MHHDVEDYCILWEYEETQCQDPCLILVERFLMVQGARMNSYIE